MKRTGYLFFFLLALFVNQCFAQKPVDTLLSDLKKSKPDTSRVNILNDLSYHYYSYDTVKAVAFKKEALILAESLKYIRGVGFSKYLDGRNHIFNNRFLLAISAMTEVIEVAQKINDYELIARAYNTIGWCNIQLEDDYNAKNAFAHALNAINKAPNQKFRATIIHNIGTMHIKQKNYDAGLDSLYRAEELNLKNNNPLWLARNYLKMGEAYGELYQNKKAIAFANKAFSIAKETGDRRIEVSSLLLLGKTYTNYNNFQIAKTYLDAGYRISSLYDLKREQVLFNKVYSLFFEKQKNYRQAFLYEKRASALEDSLYDAGRSNLILEYQEKFKAQQRDAENALLKKEQANKDDKIKQKNELLLLAIILLVFFFGFSIVIVFGNRRIKVSNALLMEQKDEIQKQKDNVEQLNQIKDKLFSVISHDLRSPFASLKSMMDLYEEGSISKEDVDFFFKEIRKDIGSNSLLLDNLLIWSKSQLHGYKLNSHPISLHKLFEDVIYLNTKKITNKNLNIQLNIRPDMIAMADYEMTHSIARNLFINAVKFTPANGSITVSAEKIGEQYQVVVSDTGIGIPIEKCEQLFKSNFFTTNGLNREKGTGLGLQICKEFVERNNGKIWVESGLNEGSSFCFTLPVSHDQLAIPVISGYDAIELEKKQLKETIKSKVKQQQKYDRYELIAKATNDTVYDWNIQRNEIRWNESLLSNFGYTNELTYLDWWRERVHSDDIEPTSQRFQQAIGARQMNWETEYRFRTAEGVYKYVLDRGLLIYNDAGEAVRMIGTMQNTHSHMGASSEIHRLSVVAKSVSNLIIITDAEDRIVWVNNAFENFTGYRLTEISGKRPKSVLSGIETSNSTLEKINSDISRNQAFSTELVNYKKSGEPYWARIDCSPYTDPISNEVGYVSIQTIITDRKITEEILLRKNEVLNKIARISSREVRSPLSSILALVELLKSNVDQQEFEECLNLLHLSADQLDGLMYKIQNHIYEIEDDQARSQ